MVKFSEKFQQLSWYVKEGDCDCCKRRGVEVQSYMADEKLIYLCKECEQFLRKVLGE